MDFGLDETQQAVADVAVGVLRHDVDPARVKQVLATEPGYDETLWKAMVQAGLVALALPPELGGEGLGPIEIGVVLSEVGRAAAPVPALATLAMGVLPLVELGGRWQLRDLLTEVADGQILTAATRPGPGAPNAVRTPAGLTISGSWRGVPYAAQARRILIPTGEGLAVVAPDAPGVTLTRTPSSFGSPEYAVRLDETVVDADWVVAAEAADVERFVRAGAAAVADGVIAGALALTAGHIGTRVQFGKPLATFQAVSQQIADVYITARTMQLAARSAAWRLANAGEDLSSADEDIDVAAYWIADDLPAALQTCQHLHGGLGVDSAYPIHLYYGTGKDLSRLVGGREHSLDRLAARERAEG